MEKLEVETLYPGRDIHPEEKKILQRHYKSFLQTNGYPLEKELREIINSSGSPKPLDNLWVLFQKRHHEIVQEDVIKYNKMLNDNETYGFTLHTKKSLKMFEPKPVNYIDCKMCEFRIDEYKLSCKKNPDRINEEGIPKEIRFVIDTCERMLKVKYDAPCPYVYLLQYYKKYNLLKKYIGIGKKYVKKYGEKETKSSIKLVKEINEVIENNSF